ncbi:MAG: iron transporter [Firmicutes bacterium]|nr:iron transporter [Bacillota bacterium]
MKRPEKWIAALLALLLLTGCGAKQTPNVDTQPASTTVPTETTAATAAEEATEALATTITLADGVYLADFETDSGMFHPSEACDGKGTLTVSGGEMTIHVSLASKKIVNLFVGTAEQAQQDGARWLEPTEDTVTYSDGMEEAVFGFDIPVARLGQEFDLAILGTKGVWYDHKVSVQNPVPVEGSYTCEVTLTGGTGRAGVESPAVLVSDGKTLTATIQWSSSNYEYMVIDGVSYDPIQKSGNSTFAIPIVLGEDMAVSACTTAMSEPHLIDYTLHFDPATLQTK